MIAFSTITLSLQSKISLIHYYIEISGLISTGLAGEATCRITGRKLIVVCSTTPPTSMIKVNVDGAVKGNPDRAALGALCMMIKAIESCWLLVHWAVVLHIMRNSGQLF